MLRVRISSYGCTRGFGEHERSVKIARGAAESKSSFLSALPSVYITRYTHAKSINQLFHNITVVFAIIELVFIIFKPFSRTGCNISSARKLQNTIGNFNSGTGY